MTTKIPDSLRRLLREAVRRGASDLHLTVGTPPFMRVHGEIIIVGDEPVQPDGLRGALHALLRPGQLEELEREREACFSLDHPEIGCFRVTLYYQRGNVEAAIRVGQPVLRTVAELGLPPILEEVTRRQNGLILVTGPTGSGKTTTLNTLIDIINRERRCKIITVEDPVEYQHRNEKSVIVQQEVGSDTLSFSRALIHILRQDPNVICIGEMRDLDTISAALTAAETGHLVFATLHSNDCPQTVNRIVDVFPEAQQQQVRYQLAMTLRCIVNQRLLPRADEQGRVLACGVLVGTPAVHNLIRENKLSQIPNTMLSGRKDGMLVMDEQLRDLYQKAVITYDVALSNVSDPKVLIGRQ